ncbi:MAG: hypothetical protein A2383_00375 [Candidatus Pacebacteria bacterium RIFOXYB1_FULL_39_46]|nr:MAG: hypothetical protein A2182_00205 [Candidatus Pacebacteria bacterium RIFOXYA1_FULL_38_18]OGJ38043.1 MAG: hypothetical protein A2383_00375 [Candidatus Pacebacteria bacterium RIFOXYB1_FULL_39_46]OGJ39795.1 MAG: hypothetical protein A2582_00140 [Candidatus Pacebacteria bacterium RIFOXYD1_FULL_39_27]
MADTDFQSPNTTTREQTPGNKSTDATGSSTEYILRRLHPDADISTLRSFLIQLTSIQENKHLSVSFSSLLKDTVAFSLRYTSQSPFDDQYPAEMYLFKSEIALIFYDWLTRQKNLKENLTTILKEKKADDKAANALITIANYCQNIGANETVKVDKSREKQFSQLLERSGSVSAIAKFILDYLDHPPGDKATEEEGEKESGGSGGAQKDDLSTDQAETTDKSGQETGEDEGGSEDADEKDVQQPTTPPDQLQPPRPTDTDQITTKQLFSSDVLRETARFTQIALIQLERFHNLPEGTLQNSAELRAQLTQKNQEFFATKLSKDHFAEILQDPMERLKLIREFYSSVLHSNSLQLETARALQQAVTNSKDPQLKKQILTEIEKAKRGENVSELIGGLAENPEITEIIKKIQAADPLFQNDSVVINDQLSKELLQRLKEAGVHTDRVPLAYENIIGRLNSMVDGGFDPRVLDHLSEQNYKLLFSENAPFNPEFTEFLKEFIILKKAINNRAENSLTGDELFALQEAQRLLDENNPEINPQQSQQIFIHGVLQPTNKIITDKRELGLQSNQTFAEARNLSEQWEKNYRVYLQGLWEEFIADQKQIETFQRFAQFEAVPLEVPQQEFVIYLQSAQAGADYPLFEAGEERMLSPLAGMSDFGNKAQQFNQISQLSKGLGRGLLNRLGGKAAEKKTQEAVGKIAGGLVEKAGSALPGGPLTGKALGWLAKNATTKEGRKKILLVGGGGLGSVLIPLTTWGGRIGMAIGGGLGAAIGSLFPGVGNVLGGIIGGIGGGWTGMGIERGFKNLFGGDSATSISFQSPNIGSNILRSGGTISSGTAGGGLSAAKSALATSMTATASQAVLTTMGVVGSVFLFTSMNFTGAFLAEFPQIDPLGTFVPGSQGKLSEYVTIEKRVFITGCPENKCENPAFPIKAEYSIIIRPKDNYSIAILDATDTLKVNHSIKSWEEEGKTPPNIPERVKTIDDFPELYKDLTINPGEELAFSYTETFDEKYNHASIVNNFEIEIFFSDPSSGATGTDNAITGEVIYIGKYDQGAGCWPTNGYITQNPTGEWKDSSGNLHKDGTHLNKMDAFDIGASTGSPVFAPFGGTVCPASIDSGYGIHVILDSPGIGRFLFAHFSNTPIRSCISNVSPGEVIGYVGSTGNSTGPHLHFEIECNGGWFRCSGVTQKTSSLAPLMPDGLSIPLGSPVRTCNN